MKAPSQLLLKLLALAATASASWALFINFCNLVYQCGCRSLWAGAADHCNIHTLEGPHCPWCVDAWTGPLVSGLVTLAQALVLLVPGRATLLTRSVAAALSLPVVGGALALIFGVARGYWHA